MNVDMIIVWYSHEVEGPEEAHKIVTEIRDSELINPTYMEIGNGAAISIAKHQGRIGSNSNVIVIFPSHITNEIQQEIIKECFTDVGCKIHVYGYKDFRVEVLEGYVNPEMSIN
jgi:hypothetical protein